MSESTYYYADTDKKPVGPYSLGQLLELAVEGVITPTTRVIRKGDKQWVSYSESQPEIQQDQQRKVKGIVDIVFLIDSSRSMAPCFEAVKDSVKELIGKLTGGTHQSLVMEWRAKVVGYRDFRTDPEPLIDNPFTDYPAVLESQLDALKAEGGEEEPESLLEGIYHVAQMGQTNKGEPLSPDKWCARNMGVRMIAVFTDATYHEEMEQPYKGGTIDDVRNSVTANRIRLCMFAPEDMDCHAELSRMDKAVYYEYEYDETREDGAAKGLEEFLSDPGCLAEIFYSLYSSWRPGACAEDDHFEDLWE